MIVIHNNDNTGTGSEPNTVTYRGRYHCLSGNTVSDNQSGTIVETDDYHFDGEFISETASVVDIVKATTDAEFSGILRNNWDSVSGHGITNTVSGSDIKLRDLEIITTNGSANSINSTVAVSYEANTVQSNVTPNSNVTLVSPSYIFPTLDDPYSTTSGVTAYAGGGQANATQLTTVYNRVDVVATPSDSVKLPIAIQGSHCIILNISTDTVDVWAYGSDTMEVLGGTQNQFGLDGNKKQMILHCYDTGVWIVMENNKAIWDNS